MDRRQLLFGGFLLGAQTAFGHPLLRLVEAIAKDSMSNAYADVNGEVRNYINIGYFGGPLRYTFDAWLRTNETDPALIFNSMTGTAFTADGNGMVNDIIYKTISYKGLNVPWIFNGSVNISSGSVPLTNFLDQMLVIRGYGTGVDGHPQNYAAQVKPLAGKPSIGGLAADSSTKSFEAVRYGYNPGNNVFNPFGSNKNISSNVINFDPAQAPVKTLMNGINSSSSVRSLRQAHSDVMDLAKARLKSVAGTQTESSVMARGTVDRAMELIKKGAGDLDGYWSEAYSRYSGIVNGAMRTQNLEGVNDKTLQMGDVSRKFRYQFEDAGVRTFLPHPDFDGRIMNQQMVMSRLAEGLALAEYVYLNNLVTTFEIQPQDPTSLVFRKNGENQSLFNGRFDMHNTGPYYGMLMTTMMYRGLMAGLLELRSRLQSAKGADGTSVWSNTVVQVMADFNRSTKKEPDNVNIRETGAVGSDHGFNQMVTSVFSGAFENGPEVVGNIYQNGAPNQYSGSQGIAAPINGYNQAGAPDPKMMASTVCQLLNVPANPWGNLADPLIKLSGGKLVLPYGRGKVV